MLDDIVILLLTTGLERGDNLLSTSPMAIVWAWKKHSLIQTKSQVEAPASKVFHHRDTPPHPHTHRARQKVEITRKFTNF